MHLTFADDLTIKARTKIELKKTTIKILYEANIYSFEINPNKAKYETKRL